MRLKRAISALIPMSVDRIKLITMAVILPGRLNSEASVAAIVSVDVPAISGVIVGSEVKKSSIFIPYYRVKAKLDHGLFIPALPFLSMACTLQRPACAPTN